MDVILDARPPTTEFREDVLLEARERCDAYVFPPASDRAVSSMLGISEAAYRTSWLSGFARAEECVPAVGQRVLNILRVTDGCEPGKEVVVRWLQREVDDAINEQH